MELGLAKKSRLSWQCRRLVKSAYCSGVSMFASDESVVHWDVRDLLAMRVLDVARIRRRRRSQESFDHLASRKNGMPVFALVFGHDRPF